jgi:DNA-binding CsgD family transcriptional regulator
MYEELRSEDFRSVYHLLGECAELWLDPAAWQNHLLAGISRLIHLPVGLHAELDCFASRQPVRVIEGREHGWGDVSSQMHFARMVRQHGPFTAEPLDARFRQLVSKYGDLTLARAQIVPDAEWHRSEMFHLAHHPVRMDEMMYSAIRNGPDGRVHLLAFGGAEHVPTRRDCQLLDFLHHELVPMFRSRLASESDYSLQGLSPRRREILKLATAGLTEKQIADRLELRPTTVNEALQSIYSHFGVHTRAQLMAYLLKREPRARRNGGSVVNG